MFVRFDGKKIPLPHNPFKACVVPRPVGWISTLDAAGVPNLAPFSFFNAVSERPPMVMYCANGEHIEGGEKTPPAMRARPVSSSPTLPRGICGKP